MRSIACKECGFSIKVTGKGKPDYTVRSDEGEFIKKCKSFEGLSAVEKTSVPISQCMTNCPHLSRAVTAALLPSAL
jgi:hypothetical protein